MTARADVSIMSVKPTTLCKLAQASVLYFTSLARMQSVWPVSAALHWQCTTVTALFTQEMGRNLAPIFDLKSEAIGMKTTY
jgi:hypothetical protein